MFQILLLLATIVLTALVVVLAVLLLETKDVTLAAITRWREAFACRRYVAGLRKELADSQQHLTQTRQSTQLIVERALRNAHAAVCSQIDPANQPQLLHEFNEFLDFLAALGFALDLNHRRALIAQIDAAYQVAYRTAEDNAKQAKIQDQLRATERQNLEECRLQLALARQSTQPLVEHSLREAHEDICKRIGPENHHQLVHEFNEFLYFLATHGHSLSPDRRRSLFAGIESAYDRARRIAEEKAKQAEIRAQIREEERVQREAERAIREAEKEAQRKRQALEEAIRLLGDTHSEQIEKLRQELAEAQAKAERTKSMAQQTKVGYVYVISNIGSFGKGVFKVGLTRRLDPNERIYELSDASVPFSFDVHAMISSQDAPALEAVLHQELAVYRVNRVNLRKEFFRVDLETIIKSVEKHHGQVAYQADPEALEYLESLEIEREQRGELPTLDQVEQAEGQPSVGSAVGTASS